LQPQFTQEDLDLFKSHADPYGHPDVNWYDVVLKSFSLQANTNIDISGRNGQCKIFYFCRRLFAKRKFCTTSPIPEMEI